MKTTGNATSFEQIKSFLAHRNLAVAGVSRNTKKFGNIIFKELIKCGYQAIPLNPNAGELEGHKCYRSLSELPSGVKALILVTQPLQSLKLLQEAVENGIEAVWIQPGAENKDVLSFCMNNKLNFISGNCILMYLEPVKGIHKIHRFFNKLFGLYPK